MWNGISQKPSPDTDRVYRRAADPRTILGRSVELKSLGGRRGIQLAKNNAGVRHRVPGLTPPASGDGGHQQAELRRARCPLTGYGDPAFLTRRRVMLFNLGPPDWCKAACSIGCETVIPAMNIRGMAHWREALFAFIQRNLERSAAYFEVRSLQVVEMGTELDLRDKRSKPRWEQSAVRELELQT